VPFEYGYASISAKIDSAPGILKIHPHENAPLLKDILPTTKIT